MGLPGLEQLVAISLRGVIHNRAFVSCIGSASLRELLMVCGEHLLSAQSIAEELHLSLVYKDVRGPRVSSEATVLVTVRL